MSGGLAIRSYTPADRDAVVALWRLSEMLAAWNDADADIAGFAKHPNAELLVGSDDGQVVATVAVGHDGHRGWMYYVAVHPERRGQRIGATMVEAAEAWLAKHGIAKVQLMVRPGNLPVRSFYAALGYHDAPRGVMQRWLVTPPEQEFRFDDTGRDDGRIEVTITYLEMTEAPEATPHPPAGLKLALIRAERPDPAFYRYLYNRVREPWLWHERRARSDEELCETIHDDNLEIYVLHADGCPAGFAELDLRPLARRRTIDLAYFGIMPEQIGRGLGPYLLGCAIEAAWRREPARLTVNTCTLDHPKALGVYQRAGFAPVGQRTELVPDPRRTGLIPPGTPLPQGRAARSEIPTLAPADNVTPLKLPGD